MNRYQELKQKDKDTFTNLSNKLLRQNFICKVKDYYEYLFIVKHSDLINDYFAPLGYHLILNTEYGVAQLLNKYNNNHINITAIETIVLIILRQLYEDEVKKLTLDENIVIKIEDIHEKFSALKIQEKTMNKGDLKKSLNTAKRFNLINILDNNISDEESRIEILPSILMLIPRDRLTNIANTIKISNGENMGDENEITKED